MSTLQGYLEYLGSTNTKMSTPKGAHFCICELYPLKCVHFRGYISLCGREESNPLGSPREVLKYKSETHFMW